MQTVQLLDGTRVPALGMGSWYLGEKRSRYAEEKRAIQAGIEAGMTLIDTAEMYGSGAAEVLIGDAISGMDREKLFLVSKVYPHNAGRGRIEKSCEASLRRLGTDYLDLYLLHWMGSIPLEETVACMEELIRQGKIRRWGVSNLDTDDMRRLWSVPGGPGCAVNQVLYHVGSRGIEYDLLPWLRERHVPVMAYCPMGQGERSERHVFASPVLREMAQAHGVTVYQIMLAFLLAQGDVIAIPRTGREAHMLENRRAADICLSQEELEAIDAAFPPPKRKMPLDMR